LGGAAAAEGQDAANALDMECSSCGFDRVRSCPAKITKDAKKVAYYPKTRRSPQSLARRLAPPCFLPAASSYSEALKVAQLDKAGAACADADAARPDEELCRAAPRLYIPRLIASTSPTYHFLCRDCTEACGWSGED
jgi:hypothetical protein